MNRSNHLLLFLLVVLVVLNSISIFGVQRRLDRIEHRLAVNVVRHTQAHHAQISSVSPYPPLTFSHTMHVCPDDIAVYQLVKSMVK